MPIPDYQTLMLPVLRLAARGETRVPALEEELSQEFGLTQSERDQLLPSGRQKVLQNRTHWAKFYMSKAGLVAAPARGRFVATEAGRHVLAENPARLDVATLLRIPTFREFYKREATSDDAGSSEMPAVPAPEATPEERIEGAYAVIKATLRRELLERIVGNSPAFLERVIVDLLVAMGYGGSHRNAAEQLGRSHDGGVDGVINEDRLGLDRVYVQAKRYTTDAVGRPEIQGFVGSLVGLGAVKGVFVTTSTFSAHAREFTKHLAQRVILIDGAMLADLMIEHGVGVRKLQVLTLHRLDEDFFGDAD